MQIKSISNHRPFNLIIDVPEKDAKEFIKTGEFVESIKENLFIDNKNNSEDVEINESKNISVNKKHKL